MKKTQQVGGIPTPQKITVMVSSRCSDPIDFGGEPGNLSGVRRSLKEMLREVTLLHPEQKMFKVWINEDEDNEQSLPVWERCMEKVREADIILVIYNGNSGWASVKGGIGICHAELQHALDSAPHKVRVIRLRRLAKLRGGEDGRSDRLFRDYFKRRELYCEEARNGEEVLAKCRQAVYTAVLDMTRRGARAARSDGATGDALLWNELSFAERRATMTEVLRKELMRYPGAKKRGNLVVLPFHRRPILFLCHAVPAAMSISAAREMLGQPFLHDHKYARLLGDDVAGPVHLIACNRSMTEAQAIKQLGFPDVTMVTPPFGVYAADNIQKIQLAFIANCRDETATREGVQRFFAWLRQTGVDKEFAARAAARGRIVAAIHREARRRVSAQASRPAAKLARAARLPDTL
jgi:hypothetical protein